VILFVDVSVKGLRRPTESRKEVKNGKRGFTALDFTKIPGEKVESW